MSKTNGDNIFDVDTERYSWDKEKPIQGKVEKETWALLYGNGLSMAFYAKGFSYESLAKEIKNSDPETKDLLEDVVKDNNLENLLLKLSKTKDVLSKMKDTKCQDASKTLSSKYSRVQEIFIKAVGELHPKSITDVNLSRLKSFILKFSQIFTTNYDLLTYWAIIHDISPSNKVQQLSGFTDFFYRDKDTGILKFHDECDFLKAKSTHIYYLHGALHLLNASYNQTIKLSPQDSEDPCATLLSQINIEMNQGNVPLFVSEGNSKKKLLRIQSNPYLRFCFNSLKRNKVKSILIFGQSLADNDAHLFSAILQNDNITDIWYGVYIPSFDKLSQHEIEAKIKDEIQGLENRAHNSLKRHNKGKPLPKKSLHIYISNDLSEWLKNP